MNTVSLDALWGAIGMAAVNRMNQFVHELQATLQARPCLRAGTPTDYPEDCIAAVDISDAGVTLAEVSLELIENEDGSRMLKLAARGMASDALKSDLTLRQPLSLQLVALSATTTLEAARDDAVERIVYVVQWDELIEQVQRYLRTWLQASDLVRELFRRAARGHRPVSREAFDAYLAKLGYAARHADGTPCLSRYLTGPAAGESFPCVVLAVYEKDSGLGFAHVDARRDDNFKALQDLRLQQGLYYVSNGCIYDI